MQGYCGRPAIVDLTHRHVDYSTVPDSVLQSLIGGRGLGAAILYRHGRTVEPLA
jgi:aldehyde:ferredoxin oxidoreductase